MEPGRSSASAPGPLRAAVVTGAAGFLAGTVARLLLELPEVTRVVGVDARPFPEVPADPRFRAVVADLRRLEPGLLDGADTVLHFAFRLQPTRSAAEDHAVNVGATSRLLEVSALAGVGHFVYPSSTTVYGAQPGEVVRHPESDPIRPEPGFRYGAHKAEVEALLDRFAAGHPETLVTVLRPCVVLAPGAANFVTDLLRLRMLPVPAGADPEMQFLHADDLARAVRLVLERRAGGVFNLAGSGTIRWRQAIRIAGSRALPVPAPLLRGLADLSWRARLQGRSPSGGLNLIRFPWLADISRARRVLGWEPAHSSRRVVEGWARTVRGRRDAPATPPREAPATSAGGTGSDH